jgi:hypothetical protein
VGACLFGGVVIVSYICPVYGAYYCGTILAGALFIDQPLIVEQEEVQIFLTAADLTIGQQISPLISTDPNTIMGGILHFTYVLAFFFVPATIDAVLASFVPIPNLTPVPYGDSIGFFVLTYVYYSLLSAHKTAISACNRRAAEDLEFFLKHPQLATEPTLIYQIAELQPAVIAECDQNSIVGWTTYSVVFAIFVAFNDLASPPSM